MKNVDIVCQCARKGDKVDPVCAELPSKSSNPEAQIVNPGEYGIRGVQQLGRCLVRVARKSAYGPHVHDSFQITVCTRGAIAFTGAAGEVWTLLPGRMLVLPPGAFHKLAFNTRGNLRYWLFLPKNLGRGQSICGLPQSESAWLFKRIRRLSAGVYGLSESAMQHFEKIFAIVEDPLCERSEKSLRLRSMTLELLLAIADAERCVEVGGGAVRPIMEMMAKSPERAYRMEWLVAQTRLSPVTVLNLFRRETGKTPHQYLMECRIRKAESLLRGTAMNVTDVAHALGFASSQHFAACFRRETGETPRKWRKKTDGAR